MPIQTLPLTHSNQYSADSACGHCDGVIRHEAWCITQNARRSVRIPGRLRPRSPKHGRPPHLACTRRRMDPKRILSKARH